MCVKISYLNSYVCLSIFFHQVNQSFQKRQEFHLGLLYELQDNENITFVPLENDMPNFTSSSYMVEIQDFPVVFIAQTPAHKLVFFFHYIHIFTSL